MKIIRIYLGLFLAIWAMLNFLQTREILWIVVASISLCISYSQFKKYR